MTRYLSVDDVILIHDSETPVPLIDRARLESAVGEPRQTFDSQLLHPSLLEQAAVLMRGICQAHAFFDGNKRTAWVAGMTFLSLNGVTVERVPDGAGEKLIKQVATREANVADITLWLARHT